MKKDLFEESKDTLDYLISRLNEGDREALNYIKGVIYLMQRLFNVHITFRKKDETSNIEEYEYIIY
jgi:hypothetical protein